MNLSNMPPEVRAFRRDLAKCEGVGCGIRQLCRRFTRPAMDGQQWVQPQFTVQEVWKADRGLLAGAVCLDHQPIQVEPHGGAPEEGDQC